MTAPIDADTTPFLILDLARLMRTEFERRVAASALDVTPGEARILATIAREGARRQNDLADLTGLGAMSVTAFLDRLEKAGLVQRMPDPSDRRAKLVTVTDRAAPLLVRLRAIGQDLRAITRGDMSDADWTRFRELLLVARDNHLTERRCRGPREETSR
ncbi:MAG: MarR family transcriptional regulator [Sedimentitalea sp.]|nr:MarR family transcriptional regulator [Sedimentitalea sp.]